ENDLVPLGRTLAPHANILSPRGEVLENGMPRFFRRVAMGVLDIGDLKQRAGELADFVAAAAKEHGFDPERVTALGYSNGANVALGMLFERPGSLRRAVLIRAMLAYEPTAPVDLAGTRVLLLAGVDDPYSRAPATDQLADVLRARGADVTAHYARAGHELAQEDVDTARRWLA
ncbi:MAG TPA: alpha/beta hydrolase, partial [Candidatus Thermoplasmatota archaeon]|nr:alpha/beta hydrolase [Candidatus Thermoplasmatota archaeon]